MKDKSAHINYLKKLNACEEAIEYAKKFDSLQEAWDSCWRGDWMLWLAGKQSGEPGSEGRKRLVLATCKCARLSLKHVAKGEKHPMKAIQIAEAWAKGKGGITLEDLRNAADAAHVATYASVAADAAVDAASVAADAAVDAAVDAADAADVAAYAAAYTAAADYAAAYAAVDTYASAAAVKRKTLKKCADIVREFYPTIEIEK